MYSRPLKWSLPRDPKPLDQYSWLHLASQLINALIFDFDGLILDTEEPIYQSWAEVYAANGVPLPFEQCVNADEAVALEDSPNGIRSAKRAGLRCVAVANPITARLDLSEADLELSSLSGVTLRQLLNRLQ